MPPAGAHADREGRHSTKVSPSRHRPPNAHGLHPAASTPPAAAAASADTASTSATTGMAHPDLPPALDPDPPHQLVEMGSRDVDPPRRLRHVAGAFGQSPLDELLVEAPGRVLEGEGPRALRCSSARAV